MGRVVGLRLGIGLAALAALAGCNLQKNVWQAGVPGLTTGFEVGETQHRGNVLESKLQGPDFVLHGFYPDSDACRKLLVPGRTLRYVPSGPNGILRDGDIDCEAVGIGSLSEWRDRRPRDTRSGDSVVPRAQATYRVVYRDEDWIFLRGRFPLAARVGWSGGEDTIAVVATSEVCEPLADAGLASMEFRVRGRAPLTLVAPGGGCEIQGLIRAGIRPS